MHRKLYAVTCAYSVAFVVEACLWVFSLVALDQFAAHFLAFYVVFLAVELFTYATLLFATRKFAAASAAAAQQNRSFVGRLSSTLRLTNMFGTFRRGSSQRALPAMTEMRFVETPSTTA
eukprot:TRINITY_DN2266_c0_g1_i1.p2 TRINITY_DN2266_c0_g1~~TRINITY_DN2266_c0_g1_i1.p2  ORF type:complete len:119 (+),score=31.39 TRINITY_DN2266_c0_g1_i1:1-357(+)